MEELHEYLPILDREIYWELKKSFPKNYQFLIDKKILELNPETIDVLITPSSEYKFVKISDDEARHQYEYWREYTVTWYYEINDFWENQKTHMEFKMTTIGYIDKSRGYWFDIVDPRKLNLKNLFDIKLIKIKENNIPDLWSHKSDYLSGHIDALSKMMEVCRNALPIKEYDWLSASLDLMYTSEDIKLLFAEMLILKPYLTPFTPNTNRHDGTIFYSYFPIFYDKEYLMVASQIFQYIYTYWDKIAHLIDSYFKINVPKKAKIHFTSVLDNFPDEFKNENYNWLKDFRNGAYKRMNDERKRIVHERSLEAKIMRGLFTKDNNEIVEELQKFKDELIEDLKEHITPTIEGFEFTMKLIESKPH